MERDVSVRFEVCCESEERALVRTCALMEVKIMSLVLRFSARFHRSRVSSNLSKSGVATPRNEARRRGGDRRKTMLRHTHTHVRTHPHPHPHLPTNINIHAYIHTQTCQCACWLYHLPVLEANHKLGLDKRDDLIQGSVLCCLPQPPPLHALPLAVELEAQPAKYVCLVNSTGVCEENKRRRKMKRISSQTESA